ncbi:uncharacterized protein KD926_001962 [Aspergillus affinis]|uniref:uncharacterized protein n=1 Tax=Aspergillus affinis TaxID=1070780 RepID=UPI0022FEF160|nr:uncharacterized protein KD926_001962 [Aspergillus affinis]KAI9044138.1 hypothetical protein KD926_001962 [Aspergillus affinis]
MLDCRLEETTLMKLQSKEISIEQSPYQLVELFAERFVPEMLERHAHFVARRESDSLMYMIKLYFQVHPGKAAADEAAFCAGWGRRDFESEIRGLQLTESIPETPSLLQHGTMRQGDSQGDIHEYPGGYINVIVMPKMPGKPAGEYE